MNCAICGMETHGEFRLCVECDLKVTQRLQELLRPLGLDDSLRGAQRYYLQRRLSSAPRKRIHELKVIDNLPSLRKAASSTTEEIAETLITEESSAAQEVAEALTIQNAATAPKRPRVTRRTRRVKGTGT